MTTTYPINPEMHQIEVTNTTTRHVVAQDIGASFTIFKYLTRRFIDRDTEQRFRAFVVEKAEHQLEKAKERPDEPRVVTFVLFFDPARKLQSGSQLRGFEWVMIESPATLPNDAEAVQDAVAVSEIYSCFLPIDDAFNIVGFIPPESLTEFPESEFAEDEDETQFLIDDERPWVEIIGGKTRLRFCFNEMKHLPDALAEFCDEIVEPTTDEAVELVVQLPLEEIFDDLFSGRQRSNEEADTFSESDKVEFDVIKAELQAMLDRMEKFKYVP